MQGDGVDDEADTGDDPRAWALRNCAQVGPDRRGAGSTSLRFRFAHTVDGATQKPSPRSSPWMRRHPHIGFSSAMRTNTSSRLRLIRGRRRRVCGYTHRRAARRRCHLSSVSGVTMTAARMRRERSRPRPARVARSGSASSGLATVRMRDRDLVSQCDQFGFEDTTRFAAGDEQLEDGDEQPVDEWTQDGPPRRRAVRGHRAVTVRGPAPPRRCGSAR